MPARTRPALVTRCWALRASPVSCRIIGHLPYTCASPSSSFGSFASSHPSLRASRAMCASARTCHGCSSSEDCLPTRRQTRLNYSLLCASCSPRNPPGPWFWRPLTPATLQSCMQPGPLVCCAARPAYPGTVPGPDDSLSRLQSAVALPVSTSMQC